MTPLKNSFMRFVKIRNTHTFHPHGLALVTHSTHASGSVFTDSPRIDKPFCTDRICRVHPPSHSDASSNAYVHSVLTLATMSSISCATLPSSSPFSEIASLGGDMRAFVWTSRIRCIHRQDHVQVVRVRPPTILLLRANGVVGESSTR